MFKKNLLAAVAVLTVNLLISCTPPAAKHDGPSVPNPQGTSDRGGGGNLINGKPIDFYAIDITSLPEYTTFIEPVDEGMNQAYGESYKVSFLKALAKSKTWYLLPIKLSELSQEQIGTTFGSIQGARQTEKEIFISQPEYENLTDESKAKLLLHELVMALFRVQFEDIKFYCQIEDMEPDRATCQTSLVGQESAYYKAKSQTEFLKADQYEAIRSMTSWLWDHYKKMTNPEFIDRLFILGFDGRMFNPSKVRLIPSEMLKKSLQVPDVALLLKSQGQINTLPAFCGFDQAFPLRSHEKCLVKINIHDDQLDISVRWTSASDSVQERVRNLEMDLPRDLADVQLSPENYRSGLKVYSINLWEKTMFQSKKIESSPKRYYHVNLLLAPRSGAKYHSSDYEFIGIKIQRQVEREKNSYHRALPLDLDKTIEFIYATETAPIYFEEIFGY